MKQWWRQRRHIFLSGLIYRGVRLIASTVRLRLVGFEGLNSLEVGKIYCGWHGRSLLFANHFRKKGYWVVISHSRDGEMQTRIFSRFGYKVIRGSTGRGGARALIESIRALRNKEVMAITPDGPRGPSEVLQEGVIKMAQKSGAALIPVGICARPAYYAPTWDRYMVPLPFGRAVIVFGDPMFVTADSSDEELEESRLRFEADISKWQREAERMILGS